jgi:predicted nucleic acid-binding protein
MSILVDTSILLAFAFARDTNHARASRLLRDLRAEVRIVPASVLVELFYMTMIRVSYDHARRIFSSTRSTCHIEALTDSDMDRMQAIMTTYADAAFDFTDMALMAVGERLGITRICTFNRRHFSIYRPAHCESYELLP